MFFLPMSLQPQQRRRMTMAWLAATVGLARLQKNEIIELDMIKLCGEITRFIQSNSSNPNKRFSLRLSTMLTHGTVLIWDRQVKFCLDGALNCFMLLHEKQYEIMKSGLMGPSADLQPKAVVKKPRLKKPIADKLQIDWEINIQQATIENTFSREESFNTRRLAEITLKEDEPLRQQPDPEGDWFGAPQFPELPRPDEQELGTVAHPSSSAIQLAEAAITERVEQPEKIPSSAVPEPVVVNTSATLTSEGQEADKENQPPVPTIVTTEEPVEKQLLDTFRIPQAPVKKVTNIAKALYVKRGKPKVVSINRTMKPYEDDVDYKELIKNWDVPLPTFACFENFWSAPMEGRDFASRELHSEQLHSISGPPDMRIIRSASGSSLEVPSLATPSTMHETPSAQEPSGMLSAGVIGSSITPRKRHALMVETVIEDLPPAASEARTPTKKLKNVPIEPRGRLASRKDHTIGAPSGIELDIPEPPQIRSQESSEFGVKWSERLLALLENFPRLTHEEICTHLNERMTKRNIATIFVCLLALAKDRLVTLHSKPNSIEFGFVQKSNL